MSSVRFLRVVILNCSCFTLNIRNADLVGSDIPEPSEISHSLEYHVILASGKYSQTVVVPWQWQEPSSAMAPQTQSSPTTV